MKSKMLRRQNFIVFGEDFGRHPHCLEHLMKCFLPNNRILWIETIGLRSPQLSLYDLKRSWNIIKKWIQKRETSDQLWPNQLIVLNPFMIPFMQYTFIRKFNEWNVLRKLKKAMKKYQLTNPILVTSVPQSCDFVGKCGEIASIYYCVDDFSLWPGINAHFVQKLEAKLIFNSDVILVTAQSLAPTRMKKNNLPFVLTHGTDLDHFRLPPIRAFKKNLFKVCYFGLIDGRCNQELLVKIIKNIPQLQLTIIGNVTVPILPALKYSSHVCIKGPIPYKQLPFYIQDQEIFILPYYINKLTQTINPLKLKEYMSTGRPVISTALPEIESLKDYIDIAQNDQHFIQILQQTISGQKKFDRGKVLNFLQNNETWEHKAEILSEKITPLLTINRYS